MLRWLLLRAYRIPRSPVRPTPDELGLRAEDVELSACDGTRLRGWYLPARRSTGAGPAVVVMHGWGSASPDLLPAAPALIDAGLSALFLDARGHGRSAATTFMSMPRFAEDLEAGVAWLRRRDEVAASRVGVVGHSVGAGAALLAAARDPLIARVVAIASMAHPEELLPRARGLRPAPRAVTNRVMRTIEDTIGHRFEDFAPVNTIRDVRAPIIVVHGLADTTVPPRDAERLVAAAGDRAQLRLVPGAGHRSLTPFLPLLPELASFLRADPLDHAEDTGP